MPSVVVFYRRYVPRQVKALLPTRVRAALRRRLGSGSPAPAATVALKQAMAHAQAATKAQDWAEAVSRWSAVLDEAGATPPARAFERLARAHRRMGDLEACRDVLEQGLATHPDHFGLASEHAELAMEAGDWSHAVERWERLVSRDADGLTARIWARTSRAYRGIGDFDAAAAAVERGRGLEPTNLDVAIESARLALHLYRTSEEDQRFTARTALIAAERALKEAQAAGNVTRSSLTALGDVAMALRDWTTATETWQRAAERYPDLESKAYLRRAQADRKAGNIEDARAALERVHGDVATSALYRAEVRSLGRLMGRWAAAEMAPFAILRARLGEADAVQRILSGALLSYGYTRQQVELLRPLLSELAAVIELFGPERDEVLRTTGGPPAFQPRLAPDGAAVAGLAARRQPRTVLVSGFLYSGSGAVFDYLREQNGVHATFGMREVGFLKKPGHLGLLAGRDTLPRVTAAATIVQAVVANVFGFGQTGHSLLSFFLETPIDTARFVALTARLVRELADIADRAGTSAESAGPDIHAALRAYLDGVIAERTPADDVALLNNAVIAHDLRLLQLFSDARAVAVLRDPRDQYVSQRLESPYPLDTAAFVALMRERFEQFGRLLTEPRLAERILAVRFEDFVNSGAQRERLTRALGIRPGPVLDADHRTFFPERSRRNIGVHRDYPGRSELERVRDGLEHLVTSLLERGAHHAALEDS